MLAIHEDVQEKVFQEISSISNDSEDDIDQFIMKKVKKNWMGNIWKLRDTVFEILRITNPSPLPPPHPYKRRKKKVTLNSRNKAELSLPYYEAKSIRK